MIADVRVSVALGAEKLVVGLKTELLLMLATTMMMMLLMLGRRVGMDVRTAAGAVDADERVGTGVVLAALLVQISHCITISNCTLTTQQRL